MGSSEPPSPGGQQVGGVSICLKRIKRRQTEFTIGSQTGQVSRPGKQQQVHCESGKISLLGSGGVDN